MEKFAYVSPVLPGKEEVIRKFTRGEYTHFFKNELYWKAIGLAGWACYLQHFMGKYYLIHLLEGENLEEIFHGLRREILAKNPKAVELHNYYLNVLGKDYLRPEVIPEIKQIFHLSLESIESPICERIGYMYPLLPEKINAHIAYSQKSMTENKDKIIKMFKAVGIAKMTKWIQTKPHGNYVVYFQERTKAFQRPKSFDEPELLQRAGPLIEHTGLPIEALFPEVEHLLKDEVAIKT